MQRERDVCEWSRVWRAALKDEWFMSMEMSEPFCCSLRLPGSACWWVSLRLWPHFQIIKWFISPAKMPGGSHLLPIKSNSSLHESLLKLIMFTLGQHVFKDHWMRTKWHFAWCHFLWLLSEGQFSHFWGF